MRKTKSKSSTGPDTPSLIEQAYTSGLVERRSVMIWISAAATVALALSLWLAMRNGRFDGLDQIILAVACASFAGITSVLVFARHEFLYLTIQLWAAALAITLTALHINAMFGVGSANLLAGETPGYLGAAPVIIVFAYTYLEHQRAHLIAYLYCAVNALATITHAALYWPASSSDYAFVYMLITYVLLNPVVIALMILHQRIQTQAMSALDKSSRDSRRHQAQDDWSRRTDPVTGALNQLGLMDQLRADLADNVRTSVLNIALDGQAAVREELGQKGFEGLLRTLFRQLTDALGPNSRIARQDGAHFVIWSGDLAAADALRVADTVFRRTSAYPYELKAPTAFSAGVISVEGQRSPEFVLDQAHFELSQAQARGGAQLWSTNRQEVHTHE